MDNKKESKKLKKKKSNKTSNVKTTAASSTTINEKKVGLKNEFIPREMDMIKLSDSPFQDEINEIVKIPQLKFDIEINKNTFDHNLDTKNFCLKLMLECLDKCEEQYDTNISSHLETIELFDKIYKDRLESVKKFYDNNMNNLIEEYINDLDKISELKNDDEMFIETVIYQGKCRVETTLNNTCSEIVFKLGNLRNDYDNMTQLGLLHLEKKIFSIKHSLKRIITKYLNDTNQRNLYYEHLKVNDTRDQEVIKNQLKHTVELIDSIQIYRRKIKFLKDENSSENVYKNDKYDKHILNYCKLTKNQFESEKRIDKIQLNILVKHFNSTIKHLQNLVKKARSLLFLIQTCRKFQIHSDKLLPVQLDQVQVEDNIPYNCLKNFWYRVGAVQSSVNDLKAEKKNLEDEREYLVTSIREFMINGFIF